jgi:hypothetical protein
MSWTVICDWAGQIGRQRWFAAGARGPRHRAAVQCGYVKESAAGAKKMELESRLGRCYTQLGASEWIGVNNHFPF